MLGALVVLWGFWSAEWFGMDDMGRFGWRGRKWGMLRYPNAMSREYKNFFEKVLRLIGCKFDQN